MSTAIEIDHVFIAAGKGAPAARLLGEHGFVEGEPNRHPGQGTANRRFFFVNAMLELLWLEDEHEALNPQIAPARLYQRLTGIDRASPFGICVRAAPAADATPIFPAWRYSPPYVPPTISIHIGNDTPMNEPLFFHIAVARQAGESAPARPHSQRHRNSVERLDAIRITGPGLAGLSEVATLVQKSGLVEFGAGDAHLMELHFDQGRCGRRVDCRPALPLVLRW